MPPSESLCTGGTHADQLSSTRNRRGAAGCEINAMVCGHRGACAALRREIERLRTMALAFSHRAVAVPATANDTPVKERYR